MTNCCYSDFFTRSMVLILVISSLSRYHALRVILICLLTDFYTFLFMHWSANPCCIQIYYIWHILHILDTSLLSFSSVKLVLYSSCVCVSLTDCWRVVYSLGPPVLACALHLNILGLYSSALCCLTSEGFCYQARSVFLYCTSLS